MSLWDSGNVSPLDEEPQIDLTPLIDCLFMLIIFFVLTMSFSRPVIEVILPQSKTAQVQKSDRQVSVYVLQDGSYRMGNKTVSIQDIQTRLASLHEPVLNIHMDSKADFASFVALADLAREKNQGRFVISTQAQK